VEISSDQKISRSQWSEATAVFNQFVQLHPELHFKPGRWSLHNFLRTHKSQLLRVDAIRKAKNRYWIAHQARFIEVAFALSTGQRVGDCCLASSQDSGLDSSSLALCFREDLDAPLQDGRVVSTAQAQQSAAELSLRGR
jgi:hypothetical protein